MPKTFFLIQPGGEGQDQRLDVFVSQKFAHLSRARIQKLVEENRILVNGKTKKASHRLKEGETVGVDLFIPETESVLPENIPLNIVFQDAHIVVVDKPSGLVVHPGAGNRRHTLVNALLFHFPGIRGVGPEERPGIVHRLDKETSGVLVVAKTQKSYTELQRQFKAREVDKHYIGLVWGHMTQKEGVIDRAIGRHVKHGERISVKTKKPRAAETLYSVKKVYDEFTLLEICPLTGRTHQIRVHLAASGHPVVGDSRYGRRKTKIRCPRLFLHAQRLAVTHPETGVRMEFDSPLPQDLEAFLKNLS